MDTVKSCPFSIGCGEWPHRSDSETADVCRVQGPEHPADGVLMSHIQTGRIVAQIRAIRCPQWPTMSYTWQLVTQTRLALALATIAPKLAGSIFEQKTPGCIHGVLTTTNERSC